MDNFYELSLDSSVVIAGQETSENEVTDFIKRYITDENVYTRYMTTRSAAEIPELPAVNNIVNFQRINNINWVNSFFRSVNAKLPEGGIFISCVEIYSQRRARIKNRYPLIFAQLYLGASFIYSRVLPRLSITKNFYSVLTRGNNKVISKAETFGRLVACGFEILGYQHINNLVYFAVKKRGEPVKNSKPTYGMLVKLKRTGRNGKPIKVYKFRTMHPYAEYLQEYIYKCNSIDVGGKFKDDFRIANWGKVLRKLWLDELPMIINFFKGDLKLIGPRPLSAQYLSLYYPEFRERRLKYKPGLIPPYYVDHPKTIDEIIASEANYFDQYDEHPVITDLRYLYLVFASILFKGTRSR